MHEDHLDILSNDIRMSSNSNKTADNNSTVAMPETITIRVVVNMAIVCAQQL